LLTCGFTCTHCLRGMLTESTDLVATAIANTQSRAALEASRDEPARLFVSTLQPSGSPSSLRSVAPSLQALFPAAGLLRYR
jgi:hypothetical protein